MKWNVVTDSSCDLIPSDYRSDVIELSSVPFAISVGVRGYTDDEQLDIEEMLRDMEQEKTASYTSALPRVRGLSSSRRLIARLPLPFRRSCLAA